MLYGTAGILYYQINPKTQNKLLLCTNCHYVNRATRQAREALQKLPNELHNLCAERMLTNNSDDMGLHRVENPSLSEGAVSLHFYFPCINECLVFDEDTGKARSVKMTYTSIRGVKLDPREKIALAAGSSQS